MPPMERMDREWWKGSDISGLFVQVLAERLPPPAIRALENHPVAEMLEEVFEAQTDWSYERKVLRLTEKLRDGIDRGDFGPLVVPNTLGADGLPILTPAGHIANVFRTIYTPEFLDQFDEEGELLPLDPDPEGS